MKRLIPFLRPIIFINSLLLIGFLSSCSSANYYPPRVNAPLLREKGEGKLDAALGIESLHFQGAYAVTKNIAISGGITTFDVDPGRFNTRRFKGHGYNFNLGYFIPFRKNGVFEIYGGYGSNHVQHSELVKGHYNSWSLQPSVGFRGKIIEGSFSLKLTHILVDQHETFSFYREEPLNTYLRSIMVEPVFTFSAGYQNIKFTGQLGLTLTGAIQTVVTNGLLGYDGIGAYPFVVNMGLQYRFKIPSKPKN